MPGVMGLPAAVTSSTSSRLRARARRASGALWLALGSASCAIDDRPTSVESQPLTTDIAGAGQQPGAAGSGATRNNGSASGSMPNESVPVMTTGLAAQEVGAEAEVAEFEPACPGCNVEGDCVASGALGPTTCLICDPQRSQQGWSFNDGVSCDDGQFCSVEDVCSAGACSGQPRKCDDGIACNGVSTCDEQGDACTALVNLCADLELCASDGRCVTTCTGCVIDGNCVSTGAERPGNPCFVCDPEQSPSDYVAALGKACGAGPSACSQQDSCDAAGTCQDNDLPAGSACGDSRSSACDASDACDGNGVCATRVAGNGTACSDGQACTVDDTCRGGVCVAGPQRACTGGSVCSPSSGECVCQEGQTTCNGNILQICSGGSFGVLEDCGDRQCDPVSARCECQDDADPSTSLVQHPSFACGFSRSVGGERWVSFNSGVELDPESGFAWLRQGFLTVAEGTSACAALNVGGVSGWRLPSIDEVRSLISGCAGAEACALSDPSCLRMSCGTTCSTCRGSEGPNAGAYCRPVVPICSEVHTRSRCTDCPDPSFEWTYGPVNGNYLASDPTRRINTYCFHAGISL
jgi:hypothetical protein